MNRPEIKRIINTKAKVPSERQPFVKTYSRRCAEVRKEVDMLTRLQGSEIHFLCPKMLGHSEADPGKFPLDLPREDGKESIALSDGGYKLLTYAWEEGHSDRPMKEIMLQVAIFMAYARQKWKFTHNDLHLKNILVRPCEEKMLLSLKVGGNELRYVVQNVHVQIIDFEKSEYDWTSQPSVTDDDKKLHDLLATLRKRMQSANCIQRSDNRGWSKFQKAWKNDPSSALDSEVFSELHPPKGPIKRAQKFSITFN